MTAHTAPDGTLRQFVQDAVGSHLQTQPRAVNESAGGWFREGQQRGVRYVFDRAGELLSMANKAAAMVQKAGELTAEVQARMAAAGLKVKEL